MVLLCGDGSIGPLNLQRTINSGGGGEGGLYQWDSAYMYM